MTVALFDVAHDPAPATVRVGHLRREDYRVGETAVPRARAIVTRYHYAGSAPNTATFLHALYRRGATELCGAAWWIPPTRAAAAASYSDPDRVLALSRLVIAPDVPCNGASFLLAASTRLIAAAGRWDCLVTYADVWRGHTGAIYRAVGWEYVGLTRPEDVWVDADGRMIARKAGPTTRTVEQMRAAGYTCVGRYPKHKFRKVLR
jgi:hypothetical protein